MLHDISRTVSICMVRANPEYGASVLSTGIGMEENSPSGVEPSPRPAGGAARRAGRASATPPQTSSAPRRIASATAAARESTPSLV
ncbi:hypothetical protein ACSL103130_04620 [Actinomyces slackii]|uniref:Uncharacterized protein n=1 Tax=Actinomyces slackii TaxID=52774 RepID=A0A448KD95_9ACTO|nr:Uncharacterised protein [Actinomyces slackii]